MTKTSRKPIQNLALIAHDNLKPTMVSWVEAHLPRLKSMNLSATGTTGALVEQKTKLPVHKFKSGPLGGDQQIGAKIAEGEIDMLIFFWDPLSPHSHDVDVKALIRIAAVCDVPIACNQATANLLLDAITPQ